MPYTVHDTPKILARVEGDLVKAVDYVRQADPGLVALVLTGGFARGEGAVLDGVPQNDYDFVAIRHGRPPPLPYPEMAARLGALLGLHVDLAPIRPWRLRWVAPTIFWYETALRGDTLYGPDLLDRIRIRTAAQLDRSEGLRLLVNRAAGLLLATDSTDAHERRIQAAKALLAAGDAHLLASGTFAPTQTERHALLADRLRDGGAIPALRRLGPWLEWAFAFKVDPAAAPIRDDSEAWHSARTAILDAVPVALRHAGLRDLDAYARRDGLADHVVFWRRAWRLRGARSLVLNPTGKVRAATLRILEESSDGRLRPDALARHLGSAGLHAEPLRRLDELRRATLQ